MRRTALPALVVGLVAAASIAEPDGGPALRTRVQQLVEMLATGDDATRSAAEDELVSLGRAAIPEVGRFAHLLRNDAGREAVAGALERVGAEPSIALLGAHRSLWSDDAREQVRRIVVLLRARRDPKLSVAAELVPSTATNAARVPPDAEFVVGDTLPESIAWGTFEVRRSKGGLVVGVDESGRTETVDADRPRVVRVGARKRPILVYRRLDRWYAASASLLAGKLHGADVELFDADLDGTFLGPRDFVRIADGAFQRLPADGLVQGPKGLASLAVRATPSGAVVSLTPEPHPDAGEWTLRALDAMNDWRRGVGLAPVLLDLPRSAMCARHVDYWRANGYSGHDEAKDRPGYSPEGAQAGRRSSVWDTPDAARLVRVISATVLHRATCVGASQEGVGIAVGAGSCVWGGDPDASDRGFPVLVPGPGQDTVVNVAESEQPPPERDAQFYAQPRGYPVAVLWRGVWDDVRNARLDVFPAGASDPLPGDVFSPDAPSTTKGRALETGSITFVAAKPLDRKRTYVARFRCDRESGPAEFSWSFTTR